MRQALSIAAGILAITTLLPTIRAAGLPDQVRAGEHVMKLNGSGVRNKTFIDLYRAGLYLPAASSDAAAVIAADVPMAIRIEVTSVFVSQSKMVNALNDGFKRSTDGNLEPIQSEVLQFRRCFADSINKGDAFDIVYVPSTGVVVVKNGIQKGIVKGLAFKEAVFGIWLSDNPVDAKLKQALLGY